MTSEIRTNSLKSRAGLSTVTMTDSGPMFSGITTFVDNSTFSVGTGGTIHAPATNTLNIGVNNTESLRIDSNSNLKVAGIVTATHFHGDGSNLTGLTPPAISAIASDGAARVLTSDGDGTATAHSFVTIESNRLSVNRGSGSGAFPLIVRRTDASGIIAEFANSSGYGLLIGQNSATGEAYLRTGTGQPMVFTTNAGSGIANERLRISSDGYVTKPAHPSFHARLQSHTNATQNPLYFDNVLVNVGSHYKTSGSDQGKFVVPVAGTYFFFWEAIKNNLNGSVTRLYLQKNGSRIYNNMHLRLQEEGSYANGCLNVILTLAAGDKIHIELAVGGVHGSEYTHFGGYLIG